MKITCQRVPSPYGVLELYRIENSRGHAVSLSSLGAGIIGVQVPDRFGTVENVALAYANPADYMADGPCLGKIPGRYANRIAKGHLEIDGKAFQLAVNNGPNHLHGGPTGFQNRIWNSEIIPDGVRFSYLSADGEEGYPGNLKVSAEYRWSDTDVLELTLTAETDASTVVNLTNHTYWNLDGADAGKILKHQLKINATKWLPTDDTLVPQGAPMLVAGTPMDFRSEHEIGRDFNADFSALKYGKGYDNCWVLDSDADPSGLRHALSVRSEQSGRKLDIYTDQPGVQVYTGNWLVGCPKNRSGRSYEDYDGVAFEAQGFPDAPNRPDFPSQRVDPETPYRRRIHFHFS